MGANIPLPALAVNTNFPNPLDEYMRATQLKGAVQQQQLQQGQIQQQQMELEDQKNIRALAPKHAIKDENGKVTGFDTEGYYNDLLASQVNPAKISAMRNQQAEMTKNLAEAGTKQLDLQKEKNDQIYQTLEGVRSAAQKGPQQAQAAYAQAVPRVRQLGLDVSQFPAQFPGEDLLDQFETSLGVHKQVIADAKEVAATKESSAKTDEAVAGTAQKKAETEKIQLEAEALKKFGGMTPAMIEAKYLTELQKPRGQRDDKFIQAYDHMKSLNTQVRFNLETNAGGGAPLPANATPEQQSARVAQIAQRFGMTPQAFDQTAEKYFQTGNLPTAGRGISGIAMNRALMNRASELHPGESLAEGSAEFKSNQKSLGDLQTKFDQVSAFEGTAIKNLDLWLKKLEALPDSGVKLANVPMRMIDAKLIGSKAYEEMQAAHQTAAAEAAKVLSSANASGVLSDSQKQEAEKVLDGSMPLKSARGVVETLKQDFANRHQSYQDQIESIKGRLGKKKAEPTPTAQGGFSWGNYPEHK